MNTDYFSIVNKNTTFFVFKPHIVENPDYILVAATGLAEHAQRYLRLSEFLKNHNVQLYTIDHIGQGIYSQTPGVWPENGFSMCVDNMNVLVEYVRKNSPDKKVILFGHSMGSFMSISYIEKHRNLDGCILSGTNDSQNPMVLGAGKFIASVQKLLAGRDKPSKVLNSLSFGQYNKQFKPNRTEFDWLSRDTKEVDKYVDDPLCGFVPSTGLFYDLFSALSVIYNDENIQLIPKNLPIYLFCGSNDPVGVNGKGPQALAERFKKASISDVSIDIYEDMRHECLNETGNDQVMKNIDKMCRRFIGIN